MREETIYDRPVCVDLITEKRGECARPQFPFTRASCSGLLIPDTKLGGRIAISEVFNEQTTSILFGRVQT